MRGLEREGGVLSWNTHVLPGLLLKFVRAL